MGHFSPGPSTLYRRSQHSRVWGYLNGNWFQGRWPSHLLIDKRYPGAHSFSSTVHLTTDCTTFHPSLVSPRHMLVTLKSSKTDSFRQGHSLIVALCSSLLGPVSAMQQYFLLAHPESGPLFYFRSGRLLTRSSVTHLLRDSAQSAGLPYESLKGHSFRKACVCQVIKAKMKKCVIRITAKVFT